MVDSELIKNALDGKANVNSKNEVGDTALIDASHGGHVEVVRALLNHDGVDVNVKNNLGWTALIIASGYGHLEVVRALLNHDGVDVNVKNKYGVTALDMARQNEKDDVACLLEEHMAQEKHREEEERKFREEEERKRQRDAEHKQAPEETRRRQELLNRKPARCGAKRPPRQNQNSQSSADAKIEQQRLILLHVIITTSADPVALPLVYIEQCIKKDHKLGAGAFGDAFLAEDRCLPKKFAVRMIRPTQCDQDAIKECRKIFQREVSVSSALSVIVTRMEQSSLLKTRTSAYGAFCTTLTDSKEIPASQHYCLVWLLFKCQQFTAVLDVRIYH